MHGTGTKNIVRHMQKSVVQWSVISKFTCIVLFDMSMENKIIKKNLIIFGFIHSIIKGKYMHALTSCS